MSRFVAVGMMLLLAACAEDEIVFGVGSTTAGSGGDSASASVAGSGGGATAAATSGTAATSSATGSSGTGGAPSGAGSTASGTGGTGGSYQPYGPCDPNGNCPGGQMCVDGSPTPTANVCAPPCMTDSDCPAPPGGTVTPRCYSPGPSCFLWGCGTATCPPGMSCGGVYCVWGL